MNDEFDFATVLESGDRPEATSDVLRLVVARHRRRRARQYRLVATTAIVLALAGAGVGVSLHGNTGTKTALGAPPGLRWDANESLRTYTPAAAPMESAGASELEPGVFGFAPSTRGSAGGTALLPAATNTNAGGGYGVIAKGCTGGCQPVYVSAPSKVLFTRHLDGLTLTASLTTFSFPASIRAVTPVSGLPASSGSAPTQSSTSPPVPASTGTTAVSPVHLTVPQPFPIVGLCPAGSELQVTVAAKGTTETLYVPSGGPSRRPFSVLASAAARLEARAIVVAVARTSAAVSSVSASFPSGASDSMVPKNAWVVLAEVVPTPASLARAGAVTLVARSASGATLERASLPAGGALATAPAAPTCRYLVQPLSPVTTTTPPGTVQPGGTEAPAPGSSTGAAGSASPVRAALALP